MSQAIGAVCACLSIRNDKIFIGNFGNVAVIFSFVVLELFAYDLRAAFAKSRKRIGDVLFSL